MYVLGITAYYHDSSCCLVKDGEVVFAAAEERYSRKKHDNGFPESVIKACLAYEGIEMKDVDYVAYYERPLWKFERILDTFVRTYPNALKVFIPSMKEWLGEKIRVEAKIRKDFGFKGKIVKVAHHLSHAAASYYTSDFDDAGVVVVDGVGEYRTVSLWEVGGDEFRLIKSINFPHSLGLLYSTFTAFLGYRVNNGEYKMMGLAAYGECEYREEIGEMLKIKEDGSFELDMSYFAYEKKEKMWSRKFEDLFGESRKKDEQFTQRHRDIAASVQSLMEDLYFGFMRELGREVESKNLCVGGGVALNSVANGKICKNTGFEKVHIYGPSGDQGASFGAALFVSQMKEEEVVRRRNVLLGAGYGDNLIEESLESAGLKWKKFEKEEKLLDEVVKKLIDGQIVGWFQGRMEFGPRALGSRSILAKPYPQEMKHRVNEVKFREKYRPFAVSALQSKLSDWCELPDEKSYYPYMNFVFKVKKDKQKKLEAVVHVNESCRVQTVNKDEDGLYYRLIKRFYEETGVAALLNTSFNVKGEPIVEHPKQAGEDFLKTSIDLLVVGNYVVEK